MSVTNFIPEVWIARIEFALRKALVFADCVNTDYEGAITAAGDTVRITGIGPVTIANYDSSSDINSEELNDNQSTLVINQKKYFNFTVDDVDKAQANVNLLEGGMIEAAYGLKDVRDSYIAGLWSKAGTITAQTACNSVNAYAALLALGQALSEKNVPEDGRFCVIPPWFKTKLVLAKLLVENTSNDAFTNGAVGRCAGFDLRVSNNVTVVGGTNYKIMAGTRKAISFAAQLNKVEAYRKEKGFSDGVKGLDLYGAEVVFPDCLAVLDATVAAEPA